MPIKSPAELDSIPKEDYHILLSVSDKVMREQIGQQLVHMGFIENVNFSNGLELFNIFKEHPSKVSGYIRIPDIFRQLKHLMRLLDW